jgi:hypothetical protein
MGEEELDYRFRSAACIDIRPYIPIITVSPWRMIVPSKETGNRIRELGSPYLVTVYMYSALKMQAVCTSSTTL